MRVGLLECDHVDEPLRALAGDYRDMFTRLLCRDAGVELVPYDVVAGALPARADECDAWLCSGSRRSAYDDVEWVRRLAAFVVDVRTAVIPYVGVCFGHQMLAHALGGTVERAGSGWGVGVHRVEITAAELWMEPARAGCSLHFMHQDQVTALPHGAVVVGATDHCPVAAFRVGETMLGIQAHPEFVPAYADALLARRFDVIGAERVEAARRSLAQPTDEETVAGWLIRFLARELRACG